MRTVGAMRVGLLMLALLATPALAGGTLVIRLVEATNAGQTAAPELGDVIDVMRKSFPYTSYRLIGTASLSLPADGAARKLGACTVRCSGPQDSLEIVVQSGGKQLFKTTVLLRDGKPLIYAGLPVENGTQILVFVSR